MMTVTTAAVPAGPTDDLADADECAADAVVVRLGQGRFAVRLGQVAEVGKVPGLTRVPGVPDWVAGVANWRGRVLPVLDLRSLLGAETSTLCPASRLLVLTTDVATLGVVVDAAEGTAALGLDTAPTVAPVTGVAAELVSGQVPRADGPIAVLDVDAVIRLRERLPRGRRNA